MEWVMCRSCGKFVQAAKEDDAVVPMKDECPACGAVEFKHNGSETVVRAED